MEASADDENAIVILLHTVSQLKSRGFSRDELAVLKELIVRQHPAVVTVAQK